MLMAAVLAAVLVMACGVWVVTVLIATIARAKPPVESAADRRTPETTGP